MYACGIAQKKSTKRADHKPKGTRRRKKSAASRKNIAPPIGTIIQLHAIVYAVIYYDFRTTLWRLSV